MKVAALSTLFLAGASAFAPSAQTGRTSTQLRMGFESEIGAQEPLGYWDPLNLCVNQPQERFDQLRYVELKHGRIAMLAVSGYLLNLSGTRLPGAIDYEGLTFDQIPTGFGALKAIPQEGLLQIIAFIGFLELFVMKDVKGKGEFPGDFRNGIDFGWNNLSEEEKRTKRSIELNNGRAAQMGILGLMVHEQLGNLKYIIPDPVFYPGAVN